MLLFTNSAKKCREWDSNPCPHGVGAIPLPVGLQNLIVNLYIYILQTQLIKKNKLCVFSPERYKHDPEYVSKLVKNEITGIASVCKSLHNLNHTSPLSFVLSYDFS